MTDHKIIDNFLSENEFKRLSSIVMGDNFPWFYQPNIERKHKSNSNDFTSYFTHTCYDKNKINSQLFYEFGTLIELLEIKALIRLKVNCYPNTNSLDIHQSHVDYPYSHKGCILYFNTCNGYTILEDGTKIESIANRVLLFDPSLPHQSTNATFTKARFNVNINYF